MINRIVQCQLKTDRLDEARQLLTTEVHPLLKRQSGFVDVLESLDPNTGKFVCSSLWSSQADLDRYNEKAFQEIAQRLETLATDITVADLPVENSTIHRIARGKAA